MRQIRAVELGDARVMCIGCEREVLRHVRAIPTPLCGNTTHWRKGACVTPAPYSILTIWRIGAFPL